ncbi:hypothetical protein AB0O34_16990 [Sphaerisporangium sp. NPDC088356]|uniref:hypothetical protein n=1 Tax=Sphaerisporangium sp. NPDC088356 TaxID=3154871 RepID=UPI003439B6F6
MVSTSHDQLSANRFRPSSLIFHKNNLYGSDQAFQEATADVVSGKSVEEAAAYEKRLEALVGGPLQRRPMTPANGRP